MDVLSIAWAREVCASGAARGQVAAVAALNPVNAYPFANRSYPFEYPLAQELSALFVCFVLLCRCLISTLSTFSTRIVAFTSICLYQPPELNVAGSTPAGHTGQRKDYGESGAGMAQNSAQNRRVGQGPFRKLSRANSPASGRIVASQAWAASASGARSVLLLADDRLVSRAHVQAIP
jgi:hypothetical protein